MIRFAPLLLILGVLSAPVQARPYYAAKKAMTCASCHVSPSGGGMRTPREDSPGRLTENVSLGADLRVYLSKTDRSRTSSFTQGRTAFHLFAEPRADVAMVAQMNVNEDKTAQAYGIWRAQTGLPFYVRAGRFFLPVGIQWDDPDDSNYAHLFPFAPLAGLTMSAAASDTGFQVGLAPKKDYFLDLAVTNGKAAGGGDNNTGKAVSARAGWILPHLMVGGTYFRDRTGRLSTDKLQTRYGPIAWASFGPVAVVYEGIFLQDKPNSGAAKTKGDGSVTEITIEPVKRWLGKYRYDSVDYKGSTGSDMRRHTVGVERILDNVSFELLYRTPQESPSVDNNQIFFQSHLWF